jgi:CheY-like chemotaxis protein
VSKATGPDGVREAILAACAAGPGRGATVLRLALCDDDATFRRLLHVLLSAEDDMQVVEESCDGRACIEQVARARPDAVLLDLSMPGMSGLAAIPELVEASPRTKVIVLSAEDPAAVAPLVAASGPPPSSPRPTTGWSTRFRRGSAAS